jgi:hypothetical protein
MYGSLYLFLKLLILPSPTTDKKKKKLVSLSHYSTCGLLIESPSIIIYLFIKILSY